LTVDLDVHGGRSRSMLCTVQWETTDRKGHTKPNGKPAGTWQASQPGRDHGRGICAGLNGSGA
jgi:hypothetical protein